MFSAEQLRKNLANCVDSQHELGKQVVDASDDRFKGGVLNVVDMLHNQVMALVLAHGAFLAMACRALGATPTSIQVKEEGEGMLVYTHDILVGSIAIRNVAEEGHGLELGVHLTVSDRAVAAMDVKFFKCPVHTPAEDQKAN